MILSKQADYGIQVMVDVASRLAERTITTGSIATRYGIPLSFLQKTVALLTNAGLLISRRGNGGGLELGKNANKITMFDIVTAIEGEVLVHECTMNGMQCDKIRHCALHGYLEETAHFLGNHLRSLTLADLAVRQSRLAIKRRDVSTAIFVK